MKGLQRRKGGRRKQEGGKEEGGRLFVFLGERESLREIFERCPGLSFPEDSNKEEELDNAYERILKDLKVKKREHMRTKFLT